MSSILWGLGPSRQKLPSAHLNALEKERKKQEAAAKRREERVALVKRRKDREGINPLPTTRSLPANLSQVRTMNQRAKTTDIEYLVNMVLLQRSNETGFHQKCFLLQGQGERTIQRQGSSMLCKLERQSTLMAIPSCKDLVRDLADKQVIYESDGRSTFDTLFSLLAFL